MRDYHEHRKEHEEKEEWIAKLSMTSERMFHDHPISSAALQPLHTDTRRSTAHGTHLIEDPRSGQLVRLLAVLCRLHTAC